MNQPQNSEFINEPEFQSLLVACLESLQRGEAIDRDALAKKDPIAELLAGAMLGAGICGVLTSLFLLSAYPNHFRTGVLTAAGFVAAVVFTIVLHTDLWN